VIERTTYNPIASSAIRVAIIEDRPEIRDGLVQILNRADGYECVGAYGQWKLQVHSKSEAVAKALRSNLV